MAKAIMIQGTMSNAGKSLLTAALCRIFKQDGYRCAPFKAQNMALNSFITREGLEIGRAQAMQAEAAGIEPSVWMNPILLKPTKDMGSQVVVNGEVLGNMRGVDYFKMRKKLMPEIKHAYQRLAAENDIIVIEGAGSPAEINLKKDDIVNMGLAKELNVPVLLVGDIDRGGIFAQLLGTMWLLEEKERKLVKGLIVNKFRGDRTLFQDGEAALALRSGRPVLGVIPWVDCDIEEEDSLSDKLQQKDIEGAVDVAVIRFPRISNYTDFDGLRRFDEVSVRYVESSAEFHTPDLVILPGTKNTIEDLQWMRENGLEACVLEHVKNGGAVFGICGGYQMLGKRIEDPCGVEGGYSIRGMGLLDTETVFFQQKTRRQVKGTFRNLSGIFAGLSGKYFEGYEIHMGRTVTASPIVMVEELAQMLPESLRKKAGVQAGWETASGMRAENPNLRKLDGGSDGKQVYGCYIHGIFDTNEVAEAIIGTLCAKKGIAFDPEAQKAYKEYRKEQYDKLANAVRENLDMDRLYQILGFR